VDNHINSVFDGIDLFINNPTILIVFGVVIGILLLFFVAVLIYTKRSHASITDAMNEIEQESEKSLPADSPEPVSYDPFLEKETAAETKEVIEEDAKTETSSSEEPSKDTERVTVLSESDWLGKLRGALQHSRERLSVQIKKMVTSEQPFSVEAIEDIRKILYQADLGVDTTEKLTSYLEKQHKSSAKAFTFADITQHLSTCMLSLLTSQDAPKPTIPLSGPRIILIVGVNGVGKTTTTGKLAAQFCAANKKVLLCAADTFRAGAIKQLHIWGERLGVDVISNKPKSDPAAVVFNGMEAAKAREVDVLLIDTAGRLHNRKELMDQLLKINRVIKKHIPEAPHEIWQVIDATTGSNAKEQVKAFKDILPLSGLIVTKLDGTAKGGAIVGISHSENIAIQYIGIGEKASDLRAFHAQAFVDELLTIEEGT